MNVWVLTWDESEERNAPLVRAFSNRVAMQQAIVRMGIGEHAETAAEIVELMNDLGDDFTVLIDDEETGAPSLTVTGRYVHVEEIERVQASMLN